MAERVFLVLSVMYGVVLVVGVVAWGDDRKRRARAANAALVVAQHETMQLKIQLNEEREGRRALEGYYVLEDSANLDPEWRAAMAWADNELEANDPKGGTL